MRNTYVRMSLLLLASLAFGATALPETLASAASGNGNGRRASLGVVTGTVNDSRGNPLAGAVVALLREGAEEVVKETRSGSDGSFSARVAPGRYVLRATASGFNPFSFAPVTVKASNELVYRFNLVPAGYGRTTPERRTDRDDPKFKIRASLRRRSIFNIDEGEGTPTETAQQPETADAAAEAQAEDIDARRAWRGNSHGVVQTFYGFSEGPSLANGPGVNFAVLTPVSPAIDLVFTGQVGSFERFETTARVRTAHGHRLTTTLGGARLPLGSRAAEILGDDALGQFSVRAVDEWVVRDGVVVVMGLDYSRFLGAGRAGALTPRLGFQFDADARTRVHASFAPGSDPGARIEEITLGEDATALFREAAGQTVAIVDGRAVTERSHRLEFGVERIIDDASSVEAAAFFDTFDGRGVGLLGVPLDAFAAGEGGGLEVANQQGAARGLRVVYTRRVGDRLRASAGYAVGRGQQLSIDGLTSPDQLFQSATFQTAAAQLDADVRQGTRVRTVLRFSPRAAVFAIDPFAGRLAVYDPSLSILITQELPNFGLPVRAQATLDARNLFDTLSSAEDGETILSVNALRRMVRGGISVRF